MVRNLILALAISGLATGALAEMGPNLVTGSDGSGKGGGTSYGDVRDNDYNSYWMPPSSSDERISAKFSTTSYNMVRIYQSGNYIDSWRLLNHSTGAQIDSGAGSDFTNGLLELNFATQTGSKVSFMVDSANAAPLITEFEVYMSSGSSEPTPAPTPAPTAEPTPAPTPAPTPSPTAEPTPAPTPAPTTEPGGDLGANLTENADGSGKGGGTSYSHSYDGNYSSYWMATSSNGQRLSAKFGADVEYNTAIIYEVGNEITAWRLVNHDTGQQVASGSAIGNGLVVTFATQIGPKLNLMIDSAYSAPMIAEFEVYNASGSGTGSSSSSSNSSSSSSSSSSASNGTPDPECVSGAVLEDGVYDCAGITLGASEQCTSDAEGQAPVITLKNATVKNLVIDGAAGGDGIHCSEGDCVAENVVWEEICEDAATLKSSGRTMTIIGGSAHNTVNGPGGKPDKVFQHNSKNSTFIVEGGFTLTGTHGKLWRSCGNCTGNGGPRDLIVDNVIIDADIGSVAGANGNYGDTVTITNLAIKNYDSETPSVCVEYVGIDKSVGGDSSKIGKQWNTDVCNVDPSDISSF
ncbi:pectate lyase [Teredinibacter franksiae]|uniref:pectate lyase n=1 Tax=Teredinibacter franksiae TaxID=2761453 RepID=UPI001FE59039|nr:pectate lyase [Teredinibacter franksiae]